MMQKQGAKSTSSDQSAKGMRGMYAKIDGGIAMMSDFGMSNGDSSYNSNRTLFETYNGKKFKNSAVFGVGFGYKPCDMCRFDLSIYRLSSMKFNKPVENLMADDGQNGITVAQGVGKWAVNQKLNSTIAMVNAYFDAGDYNGFMPYATAGIGYARTVADPLSSTAKLELASSSGTPTVGDGSTVTYEKQTNNKFAANAGFGIGYKLSDSIVVELGYKYTFLGKITLAGTKFTEKPVDGKANTGTVSTPVAGRLGFHSTTIGLRFHF
ncbi:MAG: porin family protein [Proteobacteria bacterium]|nr:porin family protein [Pseudomonadota bacterium]